MRELAARLELVLQTRLTEDPLAPGQSQVLLHAVVHAFMRHWIAGVLTTAVNVVRLPPDVSATVNAQMAEASEAGRPQDPS